MRSYNDIIADLKEEKEVPYEELRLAALVGNFLLFDTDKGIVGLTGWGTREQRDDFIAKSELASLRVRWEQRDKLSVDELLNTVRPNLSPEIEKLAAETAKSLLAKKEANKI